MESAKELNLRLPPEDPKQMVRLYYELPDREVGWDELPEELQQAVLRRGVKFIIDDGLMTPRGLLFTLLTEVWVPGNKPTL